MRMALVSIMFLLPGLLVSTSLPAQETVSRDAQQMRVTTIRFERGPRYHASAQTAKRPVVVTETLPLPAPKQAVAEPTLALLPETVHAVPQSVLVAYPMELGRHQIQAGGADQVGYQQVPADAQASPSDFQLDLRRGGTVLDNGSEVSVDSRYETLDYRDPRYPSSEYGFVSPDQMQGHPFRTPIGFCEYRHKNNPFCAYYQNCGGTPGCCDEWADFCPCFGLSRFRYIGKKDCFYGKTGCRARHDYKHGKWVRDVEDEQLGCLDCNAR